METFLYRVSFNRCSYELNDEYERLSDYEKEIISNMYAESFFDYDNEEGNYICYILTTIDEIKSYRTILKNNLVKHNIDDVSKEVLKNKFNLEQELQNSIFPTSQIKLKMFMDGINTWILQRLDIDTVLDRISEVGGIENLRQVEKEFLTNYSKEKQK